MAVPSASASSKAFARLVVALLAMVTVRGFSQEDLIDSLPGQPRVNFKQYGGYVTVDGKAGRSLYYYFVEAQDNPHLKPLSLWLNGGPGCSSIGGGGFTELGPFFPRGDGRSLRRNPKSWNTVSNMLFVESPAGVGWSYSNTSSDYELGDSATALDMYRFLLGWYAKFPEYKSSAFFLTGESYAGHYIPQLANVLLEHNRNSSGFKFNLKGLAIGNPLLNLQVDQKATYEYFWSHGMISEETISSIEKECDFRKFTTFGDTLSIECITAMYNVEDEVSDYINRYDVALDVCYPSIVEQELRLRKWASKISLDVDVCITNEIKFYLNLPEVQLALHANKTNLPYEWDTCSGVLLYDMSDKSIDILPVLKTIIEQGIPIWIFSGDQDSVVPLLGTRALIHKLAGELGFNTTVPYGAWFYERQVGGWTTEYGNMLTFATVRGASHMVPLSQPGRALALFRSFIANKRLPNTTDISIYG